MKKLKLFVFLILIILLGAIAYASFKPQSGTVLTIGTTKVYVEVVDTPEKQELGLSGRESLAKNSGMLFDFETEDYWGIWMKDMKFPIDIVWFDKDFKVVTIQEKVDPATYPEIFEPIEVAMHVLEIPSGFVEEKGIKIGDTAVLLNK